ncbi:hypothetical protein B0H14DRAFT_3139164 [Mycena olivaceomarginata]|nr:hypothetical protein B0H14DRAFT_3139164 [Mycena olivaceomarginata]
MISSTELRDPWSPQSPAPSYWVKAIILPSPTPALITSCPPLPPGCGSVAWCSWIIAGTCHCKEDVPYHLSVADFLPRSRDRRRKRWHPKALMLDSPCKEDVPYHLLVTDFLPRPRDRRRCSLSPFGNQFPLPPPRPFAVSGGIPKPGWQGQFWLLKLGELEHELRTES